MDDSLKKDKPDLFITQHLHYEQTALLVEKLKCMTDIIQVAGGALKAGDGFSAAFNKETFERYRKSYQDRMALT